MRRFFVKKADRPFERSMCVRCVCSACSVWLCVNAFQLRASVVDDKTFSLARHAATAAQQAAGPCGGTLSNALRVDQNFLDSKRIAAIHTLLPRNTLPERLANGSA